MSVEKYNLKYYKTLLIFEMSTFLACQLYFFEVIAILEFEKTQKSAGCADALSRIERWWCSYDGNDRIEKSRLVLPALATYL